MTDSTPARAQYFADFSDEMAAPSCDPATEPRVDPVGTLGTDVFVQCETVGSGRRGFTLAALQRANGRRVAIKVGRPLRGERDRAKFLDDAAALQRHNGLPSLAPVLSFGVGPTGIPWLAVPWLEGRSLDRTLRSGNLSAAELIEAARAGSRCLAALHSNGVLHANLTPGCLLRDAHGEWSIDGVALARLEPQLGDTPRCYVPPEVLEGSGWSAPGDVWALGSCLYTAMTGTPPWSRQIARGRSTAVLAMATSGPDAPVRPDLPTWLVDLVGDCLAADAECRPGASAVQHIIDTTVPPDPATLAPGPDQSLLGGRSRHLTEERPLGSSYLLDEPIGSGASGQVWRGWRRRDGAAVAMKVIRPELAADSEAVVRFLRERSTLVGLDHPNLVPVLDLVAEGDTLAIVMELVDGPDLRKVLRSDGPRDAESAARTLAQVAAGLAHVHAAGVVHRDLKPENVLLDQDGSLSEAARVTDFGIAKTIATSSVTGANQLLGTAGYIAPELVAGRAASAAADVYSLGVMAYELIAGRRPFEAEHPAAELQARLSQGPRRPEGMPDGLWPVVEACMARDASARPSAAEAARLFTATLPSSDQNSASVALPAAHVALPNVPAGDVRTAAYTRPGSPAARTPAPQPPPESAKKGWSKRTVLLLGAVLLAAAAAGALAAFLGRGSSSPVTGTEQSADITTAVSATPAGAVTIHWSNTTGQRGFQFYLLRQDNHVTPEQPQVGMTSLTLNGVTSGSHCFDVHAVFTGPVPKGLPAPAKSAECVTIP